MSHYTTIKTKIRDREALLAALADLGFDASKVECHDAPVPLVGFEGDERKDKAHVIIRRQHVGSASNDIGFRRNESGSYEAIISDFDQRQGYGSEWQARLAVRYAYRQATATLARRGYRIQEEQVVGNGNIVVRMARAGG